ncbi:maturase K [Labeo rohita]|uniref:Maturase K n=1 Tax=Labeo rohita TaxID=84645 RepID=A0ABQ8LXW5_LABRO|nr:maturase K [Labeo rohita]
MKEETCPSPLRLPPILRQPSSISGLYIPRVPKPTDIDMSKKMIKVDIPREHPYSSHISRYPAIFPSYRHPSVQPSSASAPVLVWRHHQRTKI